MLSIIICTLNEQYYLPKLLDSLSAQQAAPPFEVLVVDAGSDDQTAGVVLKYAAQAPYPILFEAFNQRGVARQRNYGAVLAQFEHLLFLDADVVLPADFLQKAMAEIVAKNIQVAGTRIYAAETHRGYRIVYAVYSHTYLPLVRMFNPVIHGCSIFVTRSLHYQIGGFKEGITFEDFRYGQDAAAFVRPVLLRSTSVRTSARRFYHASFESIWELIRGAARSFIEGGQAKTDFTTYESFTGNHEKPRY
jgi:glycosyltransferase involved in cell wall biosynthesis